MKTLIYTTILAIAFATNVNARVLAGDDLENAVAVYYFNQTSQLVHISDYSTNGLTGKLFSGAQIRTNSRRKCVYFNSNAANFAAWSDFKPLSVDRAFSIVAWVRVPSQSNNFEILLYTYDGSITDIWDNVSAGSTGGIFLSTDSDSYLRGGYADDSVILDTKVFARNLNSNQWRHIALVVSTTSIRLFLDGERIDNSSIRGHTAFSGDGTIIFIGDSARGYVDDVGMFKNDFSDAQVKMIYNTGLSNIISIAPVDPESKVTTTWGALKER